MDEDEKKQKVLDTIADRCHVCGLTPGTGFFNCETCQGQGWRACCDDVKCSNCGGKGEVQCVECDGGGVVACSACEKYYEEGYYAEPVEKMLSAEEIIRVTKLFSKKPGK